MPDRRSHWEHVYATKTTDAVSWFEENPETSLGMMEGAGLDAATCVIDVGGGASRLVDALVGRGLSCLTVLDVASEALARARQRLGPAADAVTWLVADVTGEWTAKPVDIWHDRATFHFLTDARDRQRYLKHLYETLKPHGTAVIATFSPRGPDACSGLPVVRYSPEALAKELGGEFTLADSRLHDHVTPWGAVQPFQYSRFTRR